jgi:quaternary ammonium compound-resistance protein SugE
MSVAWVLLITAGLLEVVWAVGMRFTDGFRRPLPTLLTAAAIVASMVLLARATREVPIGTAYVVWVGIGALGATVLGIAFFDEPVSAPRLFFLTMLLVAIIGLRLVA